MTVKSFADSNVVLYTIGKDVRKADIARTLLAEHQAVSVQVVNECVSVCLRKLSFTREQAYAFARTLMDRGVSLGYTTQALGAVRCLSRDARDISAQLRKNLFGWKAWAAVRALLDFGA
jgi:predicted nucleic acid-binding protein